MENLSLGIIETVGLAAAVEAADVCLKSANVVLVGYELTKGDGMVLIKIQGNVGSVNAAINAAKMAAGNVNKVVGAHIIPRPGFQIDLLVRTAETVGMEKQIEKNDEVKDKSEEILQETLQETVDIVLEEDELCVHSEVCNTMEEELEDIKEDAEDIQDIEDIKEDAETGYLKKSSSEYTCNICRDPLCTRKKGDLRNQCIHYKTK